MTLPVVNNPAVLASGVVIFILGGIWYSPVLFAKRWVALIGKSEVELEVSAGSMPLDGALCWLRFAGATSYGTALFSGKRKALWLIDSGFNLVSFIVAGVILTLWR